MKKYNISKPEKYIKDGAEKTYWANVGTMTEFEKNDGSTSRIIEIPAIGLKANVFEQREREDSSYDRKEAAAYKASQPAKVGNTDIEYPAQEINPKDIPF